MQLFATKALAAGFAVSMVLGGNAAPQMPNTSASPAAKYTQNKTTTPHLLLKEGGSTPVFPTLAGLTVNTAIGLRPNEKRPEARSLLDLWIDGLVYLESRGNGELNVLDRNGMHSFGCLQFQMSTFEEFGMKYGFLSEGDNLDKLIYDCDLQKKIAETMIRENPANWRKWYTSVIIKGLGLPPISNEQHILLSLK